MRYLESVEVLAIHSEIIDQIGGSHGLRDFGLLQSIIAKPSQGFGRRELYQGMFTKAATYLEGIANFHIFVDGNKRTAFAAAARFLHLNGWRLEAMNQSVEKFMVQVVEEKLDLAAISRWLEENSVPVER